MHFPYLGDDMSETESWFVSHVNVFQKVVPLVSFCWLLGTQGFPSAQILGGIFLEKLENAAREIVD